MENANRQINKRINAALFDAACFAVICFLMNLVMSLIVGRNYAPYKDSYEVVTTNIEYSNLCKIDNSNGYLTYDEKELATIDNSGEMFFSKILSYYYLNYLSNTNIKEGFEGSKYIVTHNVEWFNKNILEIGKKDIFKVRSSSPDSLASEIGIFNTDYLNSHGVNTLYEFINQKYNEASEDFYNLPFIKEANKIMKISNSIVLFSSAFLGVMIVYFLVPSLNKNRQTFGKKIFKLVVVKNEKIASIPVMLLRNLPAILVCALIGIINEAYFEIGLVIFAILVSSGFMIFTKKNLAVHDFVAGTSVITIEKYQEIINENK